jgi:predicted secreted protein
VAEGAVDNTLAVATSGGAPTADGVAPVVVSAPSKAYSAADIPALAAGTLSADPAVVLQSVKGLRRSEVLPTPSLPRFLPLHVCF